MLAKGILNPSLLQLLARVRHTNLLVVADRGFPFWKEIETVDISLTDDIPTVLQVYAAIGANFVIGNVWMAEEFKSHNPAERIQQTIEQIAVGAGRPPTFVPHLEFKRRVPQAIGLIRTADTTPYANLILESA